MSWCKTFPLLISSWPKTEVPLSGVLGMNLILLSQCLPLCVCNPQRVSTPSHLTHFCVCLWTVDEAILYFPLSVKRITSHSSNLESRTYSRSFVSIVITISFGILFFTWRTPLSVGFVGLTSVTSSPEEALRTSSSTHNKPQGFSFRTYTGDPLNVDYKSFLNIQNIQGIGLRTTSHFLMFRIFKKSDFKGPHKNDLTQKFKTKTF